jgi:hypothetical protein
MKGGNGNGGGGGNNKGDDTVIGTEGVLSMP